MENQAGLDGLAQAHFVGQQHPGRVAPRHLVGDIKLVTDQIDARAAQALDLGAFALGAGAQRRQPQLEPAVRRQLVGEQTVHGAAETQLMAEQRLRHRLHIVRFAGGVGVVHHQPVVILGALHHQLQAVAGGQGVALVEGNARQGRVVLGVGPLFFHGRIEHRDQTVIHLLDQAEAQFGLGFTEPALAGGKVGHRYPVAGGFGSGIIRIRGLQCDQSRPLPRRTPGWRRRRGSNVRCATLPPPHPPRCRNRPGWKRCASVARRYPAPG